MRTFVNLVTCTAAALLVSSPATGGTQSAAPGLDPTAILARPLSPGSIALLVEHPMAPGVPARLVEALRHADPNVRAAAARVIFVLGARGLVPAVSAALMVERDGHAAVEEARVVAYFMGPAQDPMIWDAVARPGQVGGRQVAVVLAGARGEAALQMLPQLGAEAGDGARAEFVRVATRGNRAALEALASKAARDRDVSLVANTLRAARDARADIGEEILALMLAGDDAGDLRRTGLDHFLRTWNGQSTLSDALQSAVAPLLDGVPRSANADTMLTLEVLSRAMKRPPRADTAWTAMLAAPPDNLRRTFDYRSVRSVLSRRELQAASRALYDDPDRITPIDADNRAPDAPPSPPRPDQVPPIRVATGYPPGFMSGAFTEAGCDVSRLRRDRVAGGAQLTLRRDGRAQRVSFLEAQVPQGCVAASRALLFTYTAELERLIDEGQRELLVLPFDDEFVACQEADAVRASTEGDTLRPGGTILPPRKTRDVRPVYPPSAQAERVQGVVVIEARITATGCVSRASVERGVDPRLDWAALRAVVDWRFDPAVLGGQQVPVLLMVSVQFSLR